MNRHRHRLELATKQALAGKPRLPGTGRRGRPASFIYLCYHLSIAALLLNAAPLRAETSPHQSIIVVIGAPGTDEYGAMFRDWAEAWKQAATRASADFTLLGLDPAADNPDREQLQSLLADPARRDAELVWLVLLGHGTYDGKVAKFNLRGPDVSADDLRDWLAKVESPLAVINCASASAPFINRLSAPGRVVLTATKSGHEVNFARFGKYLAEAVADPRADLDKDDQTSLLEAYLTACRGVEEFYAGEKRLATEHALLDDNGDALGTPAAWFRGVRATQRAKEGAQLDGVRAHQIHLVPSDREARLPPEVRQRRDELELAIAALRDQKPILDEAEYYQRLDAMMTELAKLYESASQK